MLVLAVTRTRGGGRIPNVTFVVRGECEPYHSPAAYRTPSDRGRKGQGRGARDEGRGNRRMANSGA